MPKKALRFTRPIHPGEILREEFMAPLRLTAGRLAKALRVPRTRIERIVREEIGVSADTALRLSRALGTSAELWTNLQASFDLETTAAAIAPALEAIDAVNDNHDGGRKPVAARAG